MGKLRRQRFGPDYAVLGSVDAFSPRSSSDAPSNPTQTAASEAGTTRPMGEEGTERGGEMERWRERERKRELGSLLGLAVQPKPARSHDWIWLDL